MNITSILYKSWAFLRRDYFIESSYKLHFLMQITHAFISLLTFFFLSKMIQHTEIEGLRKYNADYFSFVIIGIGFATYFSTALDVFSRSIRTAQTTGCLEAMLSSQSSEILIIVLSSIYSLLVSNIQLFILLGMGWIVFHVDFSQANILGFLVIYILSSLTFVGFGILSASMIIWLKKGDPVSFVFSRISNVLGGAYFPISVMPTWLQVLSYLVPITYSIEAIRFTLLRGDSLSMIAKDIYVLTGIACVLFPLSLFLFLQAVKKGKREGTLAHY